MRSTSILSDKIVAVALDDKIHNPGPQDLEKYEYIGNNRDLIHRKRETAAPPAPLGGLCSGCIAQVTTMVGIGAGPVCAVAGMDAWAAAVL